VLLAIDIGNTHVALGLFEGPQLLQHWRIATRHADTSDECAVLVDSLFRLAGLERSAVSAAVIACVVPALLPSFEGLCRRYLGCAPLVIGPGTRSGMPIRVDHPPEVGADRIANAVAAFELLGAPAIAIDFGTALTFDCVSRAGEFVGGMLFPGVGAALEGLLARAARLQSVELARPPRVIGRSSAQMLQSGVLYGYAGLIDASVARIRAELGEDARVIATGALAEPIAAESRAIERVEPLLTLQGLRLVHERNRGEAHAVRRAPEPARARAGARTGLPEHPAPGTAASPARGAEES
jgi:type III pantothenate kinase